MSDESEGNEPSQPQNKAFNLILEFAEERGLLKRKSKQIDKSQRRDK